jgi:pimeloyl-ACP methyl ester carboxylesterase
MAFRDDDLEILEKSGPTPLPHRGQQGYVEHDGARVWYVSNGTGPAVILLHGGYGNAGNWGYQVTPLIEAGYNVVLIDSRGHGRSTRDDRPYSYVLMGDDVLAVMDALHLRSAAIVGWSDGACTGLVLGHRHPHRIAGVFYFACNMDNSGTLPFEMSPAIGRCLSRHKQDYAALSPTPDDFDSLMQAVGAMQSTQPSYSSADLAEIRVPVTIVQAERDEFIRREHAEYLAAAIAGAKYVLLKDVSHFAPVQRPVEFTEAILDFLRTVYRR